MLVSTESEFCVWKEKKTTLQWNFTYMNFMTFKTLTDVTLFKCYDFTGIKNKIDFIKKTTQIQCSLYSMVSGQAYNKQNLHINCPGHFYFGFNCNCKKYFGPF